MTEAQAHALATRIKHTGMNIQVETFKPTKAKHWSVRATLKAWNRTHVLSNPRLWESIFQGWYELQEITLNKELDDTLQTWPYTQGFSTHLNALRKTGLTNDYIFITYPKRGIITVSHNRRHITTFRFSQRGVTNALFWLRGVCEVQA
jgi:hypothetical protein